MMTVHEVSRLTGVSIRTLQYYDTIGLLRPTDRTEAGYRLYDEETLVTLQQILLFRELKFPLKEIREMMTAEGFDREKALEQQIGLLTLRRDRLDQLIAFARGIKERGDQTMDFSVFDESKMEEYRRRAKAQWGNTKEFAESEEKRKGRTKSDEKDLTTGLMRIFTEFGGMKQDDPAGEAPQHQVKKLQDYITQHYYACSKEILASLGEMYAADGEFKENIDAAGGTGTADFAAQAIRIFCGK